MRSYKYGLLAAVCLFAQPALAEDTKTSGFRVEARLGIQTPTVHFDGDDTYKFGQSASFGAEVGYDVPVSTSVTVGPYANYEYASGKDCVYGDCIGAKGNFAVGGRVGFNVSSRVQVYGKVGYDRIVLKASEDGYSDSKAFDGVQGGLGLTFNVSPTTYLGAEISYADLGDLYGADIARRHAALTAGVRF